MRSWYWPAKPCALVDFWTIFSICLAWLFVFKEKNHLTNFNAIWALEAQKKRTLGLRIADTLDNDGLCGWGAHVASTGQASLLVCRAHQILPSGLNFRMELGIEDPSQCLTCGLYLPIVPLWCIWGYDTHRFKGKRKLGSYL